MIYDLFSWTSRLVLLAALYVLLAILSVAAVVIGAAVAFAALPGMEYSTGEILGQWVDTWAAMFG